MDFLDKTQVEVSTGELRVTKNGVLRASAIGSCVAVTLYDKTTGIGGLAHVMLPGKAPVNHEKEDVKYAVNAIHALVSSMSSLGAQRDTLIAVIAGGGNVLEREFETLCKQNIESVESVLQNLSISLEAENVGGMQRRSLTFDVDMGRVLVTVGDAPPEVLWVDRSKRSDLDVKKR